MADLYEAEEVCNFVADLVASGENNWPVSRSRLNGIRLRHLSDAFKIYVTKAYLRHLDGEVSQAQYDALKASCSTLVAMIPLVFVREEVWNEFEHLGADERRVQVMAEASRTAVDEEMMNDEEVEYFEDESFETFVAYLEALCKHHDNPFDHVLGHLSKGVIYFDDKIVGTGSSRL